jgi:pilus assembly protein CpaE
MTLEEHARRIPAGGKPKAKARAARPASVPRAPQARSARAGMSMSMGMGTPAQGAPALSTRTARDEAPPTFASPSLQGHGQIIAVFGCRGGAGATTIAVNTAAQLARAGKEVCLLDMDLQLGDVFVALNLGAATSLAALARDIPTLDGPAIRRRMLRHSSGLYALGQSGRLDELDGDLVPLLPELLQQLRRHFDYIVVDGIRDFQDAALPILDCADRVAMVATQDVPAIRRAARVITLFRRLGLEEQKLHLVVNRWQRKGLIDAGEIERALGVRIHASVRNDYKRAAAALNRGQLLVDAGSGKLAAELAGVTNVLARPASRHTIAGGE